MHINNILKLKTRMINLKNVDFMLIGNIENLNPTDIHLIDSIWTYIDDIYCSNNYETIDKEDLQKFLSKDIKITINIGDVSGYYDTFKNFSSGNKIRCNLSTFYIEELGYKDWEHVHPLIEKYKANLEIIALLSEIADYKKELGNQLELFFYKSENNVVLNIDYSGADLQALVVNKILDLKNQLLQSINSTKRKRLFIGELISELNKNGNTYTNLLKNFEKIVEIYKKSFKLYLFDK